MYPDTNGNGVPDGFENRKPISEILTSDSPDAIHAKDSIDSFLLRNSYHLFVGELSGGGNAVLLEVDGGGSPKHGACIFKSEYDVQEFIERLQRASREAFRE